MLSEVMEVAASPRTAGAGPTGRTRPQESPADSSDARPEANLPPPRPAGSSDARLEAGQTGAGEPGGQQRNLDLRGLERSGS